MELSQPTLKRWRRANGAVKEDGALPYGKPSSANWVVPLRLTDWVMYRQRTAEMHSYGQITVGLLGHLLGDLLHHRPGGYHRRVDIHVGVSVFRHGRRTGQERCRTGDYHQGQGFSVEYLSFL
jgi:hypothetical protein